jgi:hypothetical protein
MIFNPKTGQPLWIEPSFDDSIWEVNGKPGLGLSIRFRESRDMSRVGRSEVAPRLSADFAHHNVDEALQLGRIGICFLVRMHSRT